jgi:hypothetical protein
MKPMELSPAVERVFVSDEMMTGYLFKRVYPSLEGWGVPPSDEVGKAWCPFGYR